MNIEHLKSWLKSHKHDRAWLASECGVSPATVNGWLSAGRPIPEPSKRIIRQLMSTGSPINPRLTLSEYQKAQELATAKGKSLEEWLADLIKAAIKIVTLAGILWILTCL